MAKQEARFIRTAHVPERMGDMSSYIEGQTHQLLNTLERHGYSADHLTILGQLTGEKHALIKAFITGRAEIRLFELKPVTPFPLTPVRSDGIAGYAALQSLNEQEVSIGKYAELLMENPAYVAHQGVQYKPVVLKGADFDESNLVSSAIRQIANRMRLETPPAELARLLCKGISSQGIEYLGLESLVVMHEPLTIAGTTTSLLLSLNRRTASGMMEIVGLSGSPEKRWRQSDGFVFLAPQE